MSFMREQSRGFILKVGQELKSGISNLECEATGWHYRQIVYCLNHLSNHTYLPEPHTLMQIHLARAAPWQSRAMLMCSCLRIIVL